jgi:hypothetical protein
MTLPQGAEWIEERRLPEKPPMPDWSSGPADRASDGATYNAQQTPTDVPYDDKTAPLWFRDRAALFECGNFDLELQGEVSESAKTCLREAGNGSGAELGVSRNTDEGDPVITYYRNGFAGHHVEILTDSTRDRFGERVWSAQSCRSLDVATLQGIDCQAS